MHRQKRPGDVGFVALSPVPLTFSPLLRMHLHWRISYLFGGVRLAAAALLFAGTNPIVGLAK